MSILVTVTFRLKPINVVLFLCTFSGVYPQPIMKWIPCRRCVSLRDIPHNAPSNGFGCARVGRHVSLKELPLMASRQTASSCLGRVPHLLPFIHLSFLVYNFDKREMYLLSMRHVSLSKSSPKNWNGYYDFFLQHGYLAAAIWKSSNIANCFWWAVQSLLSVRHPPQNFIILYFKSHRRPVF